MTAGTDALIQAFRLWVTDNVPATGANWPNKSEIIAGLTRLAVDISAAQAGLTITPTVAARDTFYATDANRTKLVYVNNNNGSATDPANGVYEYVSGAPRLAQGFYAGVASVVQPLVDDAQAAADAAAASAQEVADTLAEIYPPVIDTANPNLFVLSAIISGKEIRTDTGALATNATSRVSGLIPATPGQQFTISGFPPPILPVAQGNPGGINPAYRFVKADGVTTATGWTTAYRVFKEAQPNTTPPAPADAAFLQIGVQQRSSTAVDASLIRVELGTEVTYDRILTLGGKKIASDISTLPQKNLFNKDAPLLTGFEIRGDTGLQAAQADSAILIVPVYQRGVATSLTISGLPANPDFPRFYAFVAADGITPVGFVANANSFLGNGVTLTIPAGAHSFRLTGYQRNAAHPSLAGVQIEFGSTATAHAAYKEKVASIDGVTVESAAASASVDTSGNALIFGDSITAPTRTNNWPIFAMPALGMTATNYAKSGASFRLRSGIDPSDRQFAVKQVQDAIAAQPADTFRAIFVSLGINDPLAAASAGSTNPYNETNLGDVATTMGKATKADLDLTKTLEAARWVFWSLREQYPSAKCFYMTPLQSKRYTPLAFKSTVDAIVQIARFYNFIVIDAFNESGIVAEFEIAGAPGRYLEDGLHPTQAEPYAGQKLQAGLVVAKARAAFNT